jgi:hypothetical protein
MSKHHPERRSLKKSRARFLGQAGEYYALFRLWEAGIVAMPAPPGAPGIDLLLYDRHYSLLATVQVKTRSTKDRRGWMVGRKQIGHQSDHHFYVFVDLDIAPNGMPTSYVVPSRVVADLCARAIERDPEMVEQLGERAIGRATVDPKRLNFIVLKPLLDRPHPILGAEWQKGFENAYELLTMPIFRSAANRLAVAR